MEEPEKWDGAFARVVAIVFVVAPLTIWLAGPPIMQASAAADACREADPDARAEWVRDPLPHWLCKSGATVVDDLGWWV